MRKVVLGLLMLAVVATAVVVVVARNRDADAPPSPGAFPNAPAPSTPAFTPPAPSDGAASPTPPAVPARAPRTSGPATPTCVEGWVTPPRGQPMFTDPLGIIRRTAPVKGPFEVVDMRVFVGPESPPSEGEKAKGYLQDIRRWYVKLYAVDDLSYQGRFLVEQRVFGRGVSAVAAYDSKGFSSPDWVGFQYESSDTRRTRRPGLPGKWAGEAYDFVTGGAGLTNPGLPDDVLGCLRGT